MRKVFFILFAFFAINTYAQIAPITTNENPYEEIGRYVLREKSTDKYILQVTSDNPYEEKVVRIDIGKNAAEALTSLLNLLPTYDSLESTFNVQGYEFYVAKSRLYITANWLRYAAGDYYLPSGSLKDNIAILIAAKGLPTQNVHVEADRIEWGWFHACYDTYGFYTDIHLYGEKPKFSRTYKQGETLSTTDLQKLQPFITDTNFFAFRYLCEKIISQ